MSDPWAWTLGQLQEHYPAVPEPKPFFCSWVKDDKVVTWEHADATVGISPQPRYPQPYVQPLPDSK